MGGVGWGVGVRVSRYWQVFKLRHKQSVLTAAALHSLNKLNTHTLTLTHIQTKKKGEVHECRSCSLPVLTWCVNLMQMNTGDDASRGR